MLVTKNPYHANLAKIFSRATNKGVRNEAVEFNDFIFGHQGFESCGFRAWGYRILDLESKP